MSDEGEFGGEETGQLEKVLACPACGTRMEDKDAKRICPNLNCSYFEDCCS